MGETSCVGRRVRDDGAVVGIVGGKGKGRHCKAWKVVSWSIEVMRAQKTETETKLERFDALKRIRHTNVKDRVIMLPGNVCKARLTWLRWLRWLYKFNWKEKGHVGKWR